MGNGDSINFIRMRKVSELVLELYHIDLSVFLRGDDRKELQRHLYKINPPSKDELYAKSLFIEPSRSKMTPAEEIESLIDEKRSLKKQIAKLKNSRNKKAINRTDLANRISKKGMDEILASFTVDKATELKEIESTPEEILALQKQLKTILDYALV